jgi:hypothetical protein
MLLSGSIDGKYLLQMQFPDGLHRPDMVRLRFPSIRACPPEMQTLDQAR